ncbi:DUF3658 domain-containing protein [Methylobacterium sp. J-076]|uniref:DUF3658 domain-containing protein n=1 Tax=Methylobacterium sp. J-076 TaxID=2836655 RepID=UPI001FBBF67B|nr:DUF3658 domain-containing protein [Methylobacterium sp. J-076]MCJ2013200.1 DUF1835 domain-containing protein [Methylobacterium sp. J-076]
MRGVAETVHVMAGVSSAETIRDALRSQGCDARVIGLPSGLNVGPIDPPDPDVRQRWIRTVLRCDPRDDCREPEEPWAEATSPAVHPVYWVCMSDAAEQASFLEFAFRMAGRPFDIIDATGLAVVTRDGIRRPWSLGMMRREDIVASGLKDRRRVLPRAECEAAAATWAQLRRENAPLRVVRDGHLVSAPLTQFDAALTSQARADWEVAARVIGRTLHHLSAALDPPGQGVSDIVLFGRLQSLGDAGDLAIRGPGPGLRDYEVRLPYPRRSLGSTKSWPG